MTGKVDNKFDAIIASPLPLPLCRVAIRVSDDSLQQLDFVSQRYPLKPATKPYAKHVVAQLRHYFSDAAFQFSVQLDSLGTDFQKRVWEQLQRCPSGRVWSYSELAGRINSGPRAVGGACRCNPIPLIVPCHRIVAKHGIGGYAGKTAGSMLKIKHWLLQHEMGRHEIAC